MELRIEISEAAICDAISSTLLSKDILREAVSKAFAKTRAADELSSFLSERLPAMVMEAIEHVTIRAAIVKVIEESANKIIEKIDPQMKSMRELVDRIDDIARTNKPQQFHPALAKRLR